MYGPVNGNTLWSGFGGGCQTRNDGDPIVLYDPMADRWVISQFTAASPYGECVAVSTSPDPTGSYYRYFFQFSTTIFYDYPHMGVWPDGYYMSANRFTGNTYSGPAAIVFDRSKMLQGQAATFQAFNASSTYGTMLPADLDGATQPPAGEPEFFVGSRHQRAQPLEVPRRLDHPCQLHPHRPHDPGHSRLQPALHHQPNCVPQPSTTVKPGRPR